MRRRELLSITAGVVDLAEHRMKFVTSKSGDNDNVPITPNQGEHLVTPGLVTYARDIGRPLKDDDYLFPVRRGSRSRAANYSDGVR